nr:replication protein A 70 kDa DNA-binding subunit B-like [Ipomoea batatas]
MQSLLVAALWLVVTAVPEKRRPAWFSASRAAVGAGSSRCSAMLTGIAAELSLAFVWEATGGLGNGCHDYVGECWVAGTIVDVESVVDWYYISCKSNSCNRKVTECEGMMYCGECKVSWHEEVVRYKVIVRVVDDSGDAPMLLWDRECADLVGVFPSDLKAKYPEVVCVACLCFFVYYSAFSVALLIL